MYVLFLIIIIGLVFLFFLLKPKKTSLIIKQKIFSCFVSDLYFAYPDENTYLSLKEGDYFHGNWQRIFAKGNIKKKISFHRCCFGLFQEYYIFSEDGYYLTPNIIFYALPLFKEGQEIESNWKKVI